MSFVCFGGRTHYWITLHEAQRWLKYIQPHLPALPYQATARQASTRTWNSLLFCTNSLFLPKTLSLPLSLHWDLMQVQVNWTGVFTNYNHPMEIHTLVFIVVTCSRAGLWTDKSHKVHGNQRRYFGKRKRKYLLECILKWNNCLGTLLKKKL